MPQDHVEFAESLSPERIEWAYGKACWAQQVGLQGWADIGMRAARARDGKLLKALEAGAELTDRLAEEQYGRTRRSSDTPFGQKAEFTEKALWREAYRLCDEGKPIANFEWIYAAAALICGYIV